MSAPSGEPGDDSEGGDINPPTGEEETNLTNPEVKVDKNEDLKKLDDQIKNEKDPKKRAELEKEYAKKYADLLGQTDKLQDDILKRFKDKERTQRYYELKAEYEEIKKSLEKENLSQKEIDQIKNKLNKLNEDLGSYHVPRLLDPDEKEAQDKLADSVDVPGLKDGASEKAQARLDAYDKAKKALKEALDPEKARETDEATLKKLVDDFTEAQKDIEEGIKNGTIDPAFTKGDPEVRVFNFEGGKLGDELREDETYYIPDNTSLNLLLHISKDDTPKNFTFKIKPIEQGAHLSNPKASNLAFLNGKEVELKDEGNGQYSFTVDRDQTFGIAQLRFNIPGFRAEFHKGFNLEMEMTDKNGTTKTVTKKIRITKKGYEDEAHLSGPGSDTDKDPKDIPEIDAGKTENAIVDPDTDKVFDFFTYLKKSDTYIDEVLVNSGSGESLPLSSVDIVVTVPKNQKGEFADMIHKSGLEYDDIGNGQYRLKLDTKVFDGNLDQDENGKLTYNGKEITPAELKNVILEEAGKKVYVDEKGDTHEITKEDYLEGDNFKVEGQGFEVEGKKLYKKNASDQYEEVGTFDKDGKIEKDGKVYELKGDKLTYYDKANAYDGKAVNTKDEDGNLKADPNLTVTEKGKQVEIESKDSEGNKTNSYGGTILRDAFYDKNGKVFKDDKNEYEGRPGDRIIGADGKEITTVEIGTNEIKEDKSKGIKTVTIDGVTYRVVTNPVFKDDYLIDGLSYAEGLSLVDKYGNKMNVVVTKDDAGTYTFTRKVKDNEGKEKEEKITSGEDAEKNRTVKVGDADSEIIVDSTNKIVDNSEGKHQIVGPKYYYDGTSFNKFESKTETLTPQTKETYKDGEEVKEVPTGKPTYQGSTNPEDYYQADGKVYVQKTQGEDGSKYYVTADQNEDAEILSEGKIAKIVQTKGGKEIVTDETDIFDAVHNAKFALRFPGFLAGKNIIYKVNAKVKATYKAPDPENEGEFIEKSIFGEDKDTVKEVNKFFTLKNDKASEKSFFKNYPKELENKPDYNFFNIFYRDSTDRDRDQLIIDLLKAKKEGTLDKNTKEGKAKLALLEKLEEELKTLYKGAKFDLDGDKLVIKNEKGEEIQLDRALVWELGFNQTENTLFPENVDTEIIIEDYNLDNRLVYDEIIVNDTEKKWNEYKEAYEKAKKEYEVNPTEELKKALEENKFEGNKEYFFIDQIKDIRFGVSPSFKEGRFAPLGDDFTLTSKDILDELGNNDTATITKTNGITYQITRDRTKGQIRIKVFNAFYKKDGDKFSSSVQEEYSKKVETLKTNIDKLDATSEDKLKETFNKLIEDFADDKDSKDALKARFEDMLKNKGDKTLDEIKETLVAELNKLPLRYLDGKKGDYQNNDMRFNAIRVALKPGIQLGGPLSPESRKKLDITSVIIPDVDIPYTDEYGNLMTNKYMYVRKEIEEILKDKTFNDKKDENFNPKGWDKSEDTYVKVIEEAYRRVNKDIDDKKITIKPLVEIEDKTKVGREKYTVKKGSELEYKDLALVKDKNNHAINPWYIGEKSAEQKFKDAGVDNDKALEELRDKPIDLAAYYMSAQGYDRNKYANQANYKLDKAEQNEGLYGKEDSFKSKPYYPPIGYVIDKPNEGKSNSDTDDQGKGNFGEADNAGSDFELTYTPDSDSTTSENPGVEKKVEGESSVDISGDEEKSVDFTIDVTVDKMTESQKKLAEALNPEEKKEDEKAESKPVFEYNERGYYVYKNSLIMDILPDIFYLKDGSKLELKADKDGLMANGANEDFGKDGKFEEWEKDIEYAYTDDLEAYAQGLTGDRKKVLEKAIAEAKKSGKIKEGQKIQAILAFLPDFEAPHGSKNQFTFKLTKVFVDKKKFKDFNDGMEGTNYTNHAAFGDEGEFYFGQTTVNIHDKKDKKVNKYLQILDEEGNVLDSDKAEGWFKGNANLKFGDKYNYRIEYTQNSNIIQVPGQVDPNAQYVVEDILAKDIDDKNGLRPVLRDFVTSNFEDFEVIYKIGDEEYTKDELEAEIEAGNKNISDVTSLILKSGKAGIPNGKTIYFDIPMEIPTLDAKIGEDGKVVYVGKDGKEVEIGDADKFFNLKDLTEKDKDLAAENTVEDSNTVKVYLDKNRFLRIFKEFLDENGKKMTENRPEVKFEVYQTELDEEGNPKKDEKGNVIRKKVLDKDGKPIYLVVNDENDFTDIIKNLPIFKKSIEIDEEGNITEKVVKYGYEIKEIGSSGYEVKIETLTDEDGLGFVMKATNIKKSEKPNNPPENPKEPEEPGTPEESEEPSDSEKPENPDEEKDKPSDKDKDKPGEPTNPDSPDKPDSPNKPGYPGKPGLPKTGIVTDFITLYLSGLILIIAIFARKKVRE